MWNVNYYGLGTIETILLILWQIIAVVQGLMAYGTAYRKAKANGDNGVSLWGCLLCTIWLPWFPFWATICGKRTGNKARIHISKGAVAFKAAAPL